MAAISGAWLEAFKRRDLRSHIIRNYLRQSIGSIGRDRSFRLRMMCSMHFI